jgi:FAD synthase
MWVYQICGIPFFQHVLSADLMRRLFQRFQVNVRALPSNRLKEASISIVSDLRQALRNGVVNSNQLGSLEYAHHFIS